MYLIGIVGTLSAPHLLRRNSPPRTTFSPFRTCNSRLKFCRNILTFLINVFNKQERAAWGAQSLVERNREAKRSEAKHLLAQNKLPTDHPARQEMK